MIEEVREGGVKEQGEWVGPLLRNRLIPSGLPPIQCGAPEEENIHLHDYRTAAFLGRRDEASAESRILFDMKKGWRREGRPPGCLSLPPGKRGGGSGGVYPTVCQTRKGRGELVVQMLMPCEFLFTGQSIGSTLFDHQG